MTRFFYTDPLKAACMAKWHGMRFTDSDGDELSWDKEFNCFYLPIVKPICHPIEQEFDKRHYIHPDSLLLLQPRDHDEGICDSGQCFFLEGQWITSGILPVRNPKIDKRNGIPFMWPESEEA